MNTTNKKSMINIASAKNCSLRHADSKTSLPNREIDIQSIMIERSAWYELVDRKEPRECKNPTLCKTFDHKTCLLPALELKL